MREKKEQQRVFIKDDPSSRAYAQMGHFALCALPSGLNCQISLSLLVSLCDLVFSLRPLTALGPFETPTTLLSGYIYFFFVSL